MKSLRLTLLGLALLFVSCMTTENSEKTPSQQRSHLLVGLAYDISGSVNNWPEPDTISLRALANIVGERGGVIALGWIADESFRPLLKYPFALDTLQVKGRLSEKARINTKNKRAKARFAQDISQFLTAAQEKFLVTRNRRATDIEGSFARFSLLFQEPQYTEYERYLIVLSDGDDTVSRRIHTIPNARILAVGWRNLEQAKRIFKDNLLAFESLDGVISHLNVSQPTIATKN